VAKPRYTFKPSGFLGAASFTKSNSSAKDQKAGCASLSRLRATSSYNREPKKN
jgi:hypothetical protein